MEGGAGRPQLIVKQRFSVSGLTPYAVTGCHPLTSLGVPGIINTKPSVPPRGGSTLGYYYAALTGSNRRSPAARKLIAKFQFIEQRGGFFQNVADISILYKIFGTRVYLRGEVLIRLDFGGLLVYA